MKITISSKWYGATNEKMKADGYWGLCVSATGKDPVTVDGVVAVRQQYGADVAVLQDGNEWALRDVIRQARAEKNGLRVAA